MADNQLNKIQIKAEILTVLSKLQKNIDGINVEETLGVLLQQEDKQSILDVLSKELIKAGEQKAVLVSFLIIKLCEKDKAEDTFWTALKNPSVPDSVKTIILNVLKDMGNRVDYNQLEEYFENPNDVIDADTQKLLQAAIINPEAQIDFLDFLNSLSEFDKKILVQSLGDDYSSDALANILNPLVLYTPESELGQTAIEILGTTKSQLALHTLLEALRFVDDEVTSALIKKNISKLKISGIRDDNAIDFYKSLLASKPYFSYTSYPDGHGNQAIIFSREKEDESIQMFAIVINDIYGLVDCFGFNNISKNEFERIVGRFYGNDEHIYLNPAIIKFMLLDSEKLTRKTGNKVSYEYLCWKTLLSDIQEEKVPLELILKSKCEQKPLSVNDLENIFMFDFVQKWFFDTEYNEEFRDLISELNDKVKINNFDIDFESAIQKHFDKIYTANQKALLDKRLLMGTYLKYLSIGRPNAKEEACLLYSLYFDEKNKIKLAENILRKSIYEYYVTMKFKYKEASKATNIFSMRNKQTDLELTLKQIESAIAKIESLWVYNA